MNQLDLFYDNLPQKPYCTDDLGNLLIRPAASAIKRRYIQPNKPTDLKWLVYDIDRPTAYFDWYDLKAPNPNIVVMNRDNGHAHLFYGLEVPVYKQPSAQQKPLRYAASVDVALAKKLDADPGYAGLICKNPHHKSWEVGIFESVSYDLNWLADYVDLDPFYDRRKHLPPVGLGRNCTLFDVTRHWSYRQIRKPQGWLSESFFVEAVIEYAYSYNLTFPCPLPSREVKATGKSIGKWTFRNMSAEGFRSWGENRRRASIRVRSASAQEKAQTIREYKKTHPEATTRAIAEIFEVTAMTVSRYLRG